MALAKVHGLDLSYLEHLGFKGQHDLISDEEGGSKNHPSFLPALSDQINLYSHSSLMFAESVSSPQEAQNSFNVKAGTDHWKQANSSVLSFEEKLGFGENCINWIEPMYHDYQMNYFHNLSGSNCCEVQASDFGLLDNQPGQNRFKILYSSINSGEDLEGISRKQQGQQKRQLLVSSFPSRIYCCV